MSLRRTALARKTELRRGAALARTGIARTREAGARKIKASQRTRDTGPPPATRQLVVDRAGGCCEVCGTLLHDGYGWLAAHSIHHRQPRGMGGTSRPEINSPANLLLLCGSATSPEGCHAVIEKRREAAIALGYLVPQGTDPAATSVYITPPGARVRRVLLTHDGHYQEAA